MSDSEDFSPVRRKGRRAADAKGRARIDIEMDMRDEVRASGRVSLCFSGIFFHLESGYCV